jgi:hypothetical protein
MKYIVWLKWEGFARALSLSLSLSLVYFAGHFDFEIFLGGIFVFGHLGRYCLGW